MGCGASVLAEQKQSEAIDELVERDHEKDKQRIKLLLLGAGESGKSTIFKQMRILYGKGFAEEDRRNFKPVIFSNTLLSIKALVQQADELGFNVEAATDKDLVAGLADDTALDPKIAASIERLWQDPGIRQTYDNRSRFQLNDSADFFLSKVTALAAANYVPSEEDVLRSRVRTSGIIEESYDIGGVDFCIYDVGGQRNERKKWIHCFDAVTAVIFVASLSEYDQVLFEDASVNRMVEAINLFSEICNSKWFEHSAMILFLNKKDLFQRKIATVDVRHEGGDGTPPRFLDYTGGCDYEKAKRYITERFIEHNRRTDASQVSSSSDRRGSGRGTGSGSTFVWASALSSSSSFFFPSFPLPFFSSFLSCSAHRARDVRHRHGQRARRVRDLQGGHPQGQQHRLGLHGHVKRHEEPGSREGACALSFLSLSSFLSLAAILVALGSDYSRKLKDRADRVAAAAAAGGIVVDGGVGDMLL